MNKNVPDDELAAAVKRAQGQPRLLQELAAMYDRLHCEQRSHKNTCELCGRCCDFGSFDHRLFVTAIELALLTQEAPSAAAGQRCSYQLGDQCTARGRRALGCRVFFCRTTAQESALYEHYHAQLCALHEKFNVPYLYVELLEGMSRLGLHGRQNHE
jgi:hypothetical protein